MSNDKFAIAMYAIAQENERYEREIAKINRQEKIMFWIIIIAGVALCLI